MSNGCLQCSLGMVAKSLRTVSLKFLGHHDEDFNVFSISSRMNVEKYLKPLPRGGEVTSMTCKGPKTKIVFMIRRNFLLPNGKKNIRNLSSTLRNSG